MVRISDEEAKKKRDLFIEAYLGEAKGNGALAARMAGYSEQRSSQTASELLQEEYVKEKLRTYQNIQKETKTDGYGSTTEIFDTLSVTALSTLANLARTDSNAAKQFLELKLKYDKQREESLGAYEKLSTDELMREFDSVCKEGKELVQRIMETYRAGEVSDGSNISSEQSVGTQGPKEECVGESSPENSKPA